LRFTLVPSTSTPFAIDFYSHRTNFFRKFVLLNMPSVSQASLGYIHQIMQKVEGNITFHTARGTAFPLPTPGSVPQPLPVVVEATQLKKMLASTSVNYTETNHSLAVVDSTLE
jgi:hypothetical protein